MKSTEPGRDRLFRRCAALVMITAITFLFSCGDKDRVTFKSSGAPGGLLVGHTPDCKTYGGSAEEEAFPLSDECLSYKYDGSDTLYIDHINAGFNCCPGEIIADIAVRNDSITIREGETEGLCDCYCLFDTYYKIPGLKPREYTVVFHGPYLSESDRLLSLTFDLSVSPEGSTCVSRLHYPWQIAPPSAEVESYSGCKVFPNEEYSSSYAGASSSEDCVNYEYTDGNLLVLDRENAGFNCCPTSLDADVEIESGTIIITETEVLDNPCRCLCLYDMKIAIENLPAGRYRIRFVEIYTLDRDKPMEFEADLVNHPSGRFCVTRDHYPWGS